MVQACGARQEWAGVVVQRVQVEVVDAFCEENADGLDRHLVIDVEDEG